MLRKFPGFAAVATLIIALGIGASPMLAGYTSPTQISFSQHDD